MIEIRQADITTLSVDAIVNAANETLLGGGGVDGAIHHAAGPKLLDHCRGLGGCATGNARITPGFRLPAKYVIHTVGPVWKGGHSGEAEQLRSCYVKSFWLAEESRVKSIAFPAISTGVYGYPSTDAASIALQTIRENEFKFDLIIVCCFSAADVTVYETVFSHKSLAPFN